MTPEDIALTLQPGLRPRGIIHLLELYGSAEALFAASQAELEERAGLRAEIAADLVRRKFIPRARQELKYCERHGIAAIASTDGAYPPLMRESSDYPHVLYVKGDVESLTGRTLTMVGTRRMTSYGAQMCDRIVAELAERIPGLVIVSGLAFGVDAECHRAALRYGVRTIAAVANPLPEVTPAAHADLAREIVARSGALLSELPSGSPQFGTHYLARNRLLAALSAGALVIESALRGGSLHTAQYADSYDRTVMALPGRATDLCSAGTNRLIRNRKAQMVLSADDVIRELMWDVSLADCRPRRSTPAEALAADEAALLRCFPEERPVSFDTLLQVSGLQPGELTSMLLGLELASAVRQLPGRIYEKNPRYGA